MNNTFFKAPILLTAVLALFLFSCDQNDPRRTDFSTVPDPYSIAGAEKITTESGLQYYIIDEGICPSGDEELCSVNSRDQIEIFYTKRLKRNTDRIISSSYANGVEAPVSTIVAGSRIIVEEGFKQGVVGMKKGEKRVLVLPPDLAYGNNPNSQYTNDTLWIDLELDGIIY